MTPLAQAIVGNLYLPLQQRDEGFDANLAKGIMAGQCFEVSVIFDLLGEFLEREQRLPAPDKLLTSFLPSEPTWLEAKTLTKTGLRLRWGYLIQSEGEGEYLVRSVIGSEHARHYVAGRKVKPSMPDEGGPELFNTLALVNTPRTFGRKQHQPHAGLQRKIAKALGLVGKFPLHAWTEITLNLGPPADLSGEGDHIAMLSGRMPLHYVRAHLRALPQGLIVVKGYWRGDPSIGIKRSRYLIANKGARGIQRMPELEH